MTELSRDLGRRATLDDIPDATLDHLAEQGFDWIWFLSVWQTGTIARSISRSNLEWRHEFETTLPNLSDYDIAGSGFAVQDYRTHVDLGGDAALARLRARLQQRGLKLMLDFVPNHMAPDHPWINEHPEYFVPGTEEQLQREPQNYLRLTLNDGSSRVFAKGRDPYFSGWPDVVQLNYGNQELQQAMLGELTRLAGQCDGLRCDMAMLVLPLIFKNTWGISMSPFWPWAIPAVHAVHPEFCFLAEVYWDLEWTLQQQGFHYTYDKRLYDRLHEGNARHVREHLYAGLDFQDRLARFLENHDEPRAAAIFDDPKHKAAAVITYLSPGLRFLHDGQFEGRKVRVSPHLVRRPDEPINEDLRSFYDMLLPVIARPEVRDGTWQLLDCVPGWQDNTTNGNYVSFAWTGTSNERLLVVVNLSAQPAQCRIRLPHVDSGEGELLLVDLLGGAEYTRSASVLTTEGMFFDEPGWKAQVFTVKNSPDLGK